LFAGVVATVVVFMLGLGFIMSRRDRRAGRTSRDASAMWKGDVREQDRDVRAAHEINFLEQDVSWTRHHQRGEQ
jgi:hypothetical protein